MSKDFWVTKHGEIVKIVDMDDAHLLNSIKFVGRMVEKGGQLTEDGTEVLANMIIESCKRGLHDTRSKGKSKS